MSDRPHIDHRSVLEAAFAARDTDPELFGMWLADTYVSEHAHHEQTPEDFHHYASSLGECMRKYVLVRSGVPKDDFTVESLTTFEVGKHMHLLLQFGLAVHPTYTLLGAEVGGTVERNGYKLSARSDAIAADDQQRVGIIEVKSERSYARKYREEEAKAAGREHTAKPEHALQLQATAGIVHSLTEHRPMWGCVWYWDKDSGAIDVQWVRLGIGDVVAAIEEREAAWTTHTLGGALPDPLGTFPEKGLCKPRSKTDQRGLYCPVREICMKGAA